jgi:hypothetical protein
MTEEKSFITLALEEPNRGFEREKWLLSDPGVGPV